MAELDKELAGTSRRWQQYLRAEQAREEAERAEALEALAGLDAFLASGEDPRQSVDFNFGE